MPKHRLHHYTSAYAKRARIERSQLIFDDAARLAKRFLAETADDRHEIHRMVIRTDFRHRIDQLIMRVMVPMEDMIDRLSRGTHYMIIMDQNHQLEQFKRSVMRGLHIFWCDMQNLLCVFLAGGLAGSTNSGRQFPELVPRGVRLLHELNRLYTKNMSKYESCTYTPFSNGTMCKIMSNISTFVGRDLRWSTVGNVGVKLMNQENVGNVHTQQGSSRQLVVWGN